MVIDEALLDSLEFHFLDRSKRCAVIHEWVHLSKVGCRGLIGARNALRRHETTHETNFCIWLALRFHPCSLLIDIVRSIAVVGLFPLVMWRYTRLLPCVCAMIVFPMIVCFNALPVEPNLETTEASSFITADLSLVELSNLALRWLLQLSSCCN